MTGLYLSLKLNLKGSTESGDDAFYLAIGGDSLASKLGSNTSNGPAFITALENYFGEGNVDIGEFAQGGLRTLGSWDRANDAEATIHFWEDETSEPAAKLDGLINTMGTASQVKAVVLVLGTNDANDAINTGYPATYNKAGYKQGLIELCAHLKTVKFPSCQKIFICRFHVNDTSDFAPMVYQSIVEAQQEVCDEVDYVETLPDIWDVDKYDAVHPTGEESGNPATAAYQAQIIPRFARAIASGMGVANAGGQLGPQVSSVTMYTDRIECNIDHDEGTDLTVPSNAYLGFKLMLGGTFTDDAITTQGTFKQPSAVTKDGTSKLILSLDQVNITPSTAARKLYVGYGQVPELSRTSVEVVKDNAAAPLPLRKGRFNLTDTDLIRTLPNSFIDFSAKVGVRTFSGSDLTQLDGAQSLNLASAANRYGQYDGSDFNGQGCILDPDGTTHYRSSAWTASGLDTGFGGCIFSIPSGAAADDDCIISLGNNSAGSQRFGLLYQTSTDTLQWRRNNSDNNTQIASSAKGKKWIVLWNFRSASAVDFYCNSLTPVTFDPYDGVGSHTRMWLFQRATTGNSLSGLRIARAFHTFYAHNSGADPSISAIMNWANSVYGLGLTL